MLKRSAIGIGLVAAAVAVVMVVTDGFSPGSVTADMPRPSTQQRHTMQDFHGLREGISYDDASRTLGHPGHEALKGNPERLPATPFDADVYVWPNPDGSRIVLVFAADRLVDKRQVGLR